jgi:hypothetical protein
MLSRLVLRKWSLKIRRLECLEAMSDARDYMSGDLSVLTSNCDASFFWRCRCRHLYVHDKSRA